MARDLLAGRPWHGAVVSFNQPTDRQAVSAGLRIDVGQGLRPAGLDALKQMGNTLIWLEFFRRQECAIPLARRDGLGVKSRQLFLDGNGRDAHAPQLDAR